MGSAASRGFGGNGGRRQLELVDDSVHLMATRNRKKRKKEAAAAVASNRQHKNHLCQLVDDSVHVMSRKAYKKKKCKEKEEEDGEVSPSVNDQKQEQVAVVLADESTRASDYTETTTCSSSNDDLGHKEVDDQVTTTDQKIKKKVVSFSTVQIREYPIAIGDNPGGALMGVPITMDWDYHSAREDATDDFINNEIGAVVPSSQSLFLLNLDDYEATQLSRRRHDLELRMSMDDRKKLLKKLGYTAKEIQMGVRDANKTRVQRNATVQYMHLSPVEELCEKISRAIKNATPTGRSSKQAERALLAKYVVVNNKKNKTKRKSPTLMDASSSTITTSKLVASNSEL